MRTLSRLAGVLRIEDVLLALAAAVILPGFDKWLSGGTVRSDTGGEPTVLAGLAGLLAIAGVLACVLTRGPDDAPPLADGQLTLQGWARFPLAAGVGIVAAQTIPALGVDPQLLVALVFVTTFAGAALHERLPVVDAAWRRTMVLPMVLLAAGAFDRIIGGELGGVVVDFVGGVAPSEVVALWPLILAAVAMVYVLLVVAPRAIADPGASGMAWAVRFLFLLVSVSVAALLGVG